MHGRWRKKLSNRSTRGGYTRKTQNESVRSRGRVIDASADVWVFGLTWRASRRRRRGLVGPESSMKHARAGCTYQARVILFVSLKFDLYGYLCWFVVRKNIISLLKSTDQVAMTLFFGTTSAVLFSELTTSAVLFSELTIFFLTTNQHKLNLNEMLEYCRGTCRSSWTHGWSGTRRCRSESPSALACSGNEMEHNGSPGPPPRPGMMSRSPHVS
jgi:hypothetical protein